MISYINGVLSSFQPISLASMDPVKLMTRIDEKYICRIDQLPGILDSARPDCQVLENNGKRILGYESMYLDTPDHGMYLMHHNGKLNRYKIRIREYKESHELFFEIKFKDNHRRTTKKRISIGPDRNYHADDIRKFMSGNTIFTPEMLEPKIFSSFERITLVNSKFQERITIDLHPEWCFGDRQVSLPEIVVVEVKSAKPSNTAGFGYLLREARVFPHRMSKYCTGTVFLYPEIRHNRFKAKLLHLKKIEKRIEYNESFPAVI